MPKSDGQSRLRRIPIYRYAKSGKLAAIVAESRDLYTVLELASDLSTITALRNPKYVRRDSTQATKHVLEVEETIEPADHNQNYISYRLVRVLGPDELDTTKWQPERKPIELPVSPSAHFSPEELIWAGKKEGNAFPGVLLILAFFGSLAGLVWSASTHGNWFFPLIASAAFGYFLVTFKWEYAAPPTPQRLKDLTKRKDELRRQKETDRQVARTSFEAMLQSFDNWKRLTPEEFELAISMRLEKEGYVVRTTRYSRDGGIDIEATDRTQRTTIVQCKQFNDNVGVAVVREILGVRQSRSDSPKAMIYALSGFSRDARAFALANDVELRDIRSELVKI